MWKRLKQWLGRTQQLTPPEFRLIDFTKPTATHWAGFDGGNNYDACFTIKCARPLHFKDYILVRLQSGRIGRYRVFSALPDFSRVADWKVRAVAVGYWEPDRTMAHNPSRPAPKTQGLLCAPTGGIRPPVSQSPALPRGFTKPTSDFWKVFARDEACHRRTSTVRAGGNL